MITRDIETNEEAKININPIAGINACEDAQKWLLELQLKMATSSINHEYARLEFDDVSDRERREELLDYMHACRSEYFEARSALEAHDRYALDDFERDLLRQKQETIAGYTA